MRPNKQQKDKRRSEMILVCASILLIAIAMVLPPAQKGEQQANVKKIPQGDIDELSTEELQILLADAIRQQVWELATFYRDEINKRNAIRKTG